MKAALLTIHLLAAVPDTIPYIRNGYYNADTANTTQQLRMQNHQMAKQLKQADKTSGWLAVVGLVIGVMLGFGVGSVTK